MGEEQNEENQAMARVWWKTSVEAQKHSDAIRVEVAIPGGLALLVGVFLGAFFLCGRREKTMIGEEVGV